MLELKNVKKDYPAGDDVVHALKGIDLQFRENEFVAILGPSGCGKTTLLNIIGGLDQYTEGDLVINGTSTKDYRDRDWDAYRNHSVGFVFQSYNLIPHQTVLQNVEIALTLTGVSKAERRARAREALEKVGLGNQLKKRPAQMSGGQMQRVAIARALVNDPDIILADEPTGALDTETSVQVMEILKEVSKDRLVVMVTHNPDLADRYSTRIIRMLDGEITGDSSPLTAAERETYRKSDAEKAAARASRKKREKKPSMSFATSFSLSLRNLGSKKGRTALVSFAGSIGIIGIALVYAVSQGMTTYIDELQEDTLSSYPLTIEATTIDLNTLMTTFQGTRGKDEVEHSDDAVYSQSMLFDMVNSLNDLESTENDLTSFKAYIEEAQDSDPALSEALSGVQYTYDTDLQVYTKNVDGDIIFSDTQTLLSDAIRENMGMDMTSMMDLTSGNSSLSGLMSMSSSMTSMSGMGGGSAVLWQEMLPGRNGEIVSPLLESQYDVIYGSWPTAYDEIVLVVDANNELSDLTLYALGLESKEKIDSVFRAVTDGEEIDTETRSWSFEELCDMDFRVVLSADCYSLDTATGLYTDLRNTDAGLRYLYDNAMPLKISGIIRPREDAVSTILSGSIGYTSQLTEYIIQHAEGSDAVKAQKADEATDIFTGLPFKATTGSLTDEEKEDEFRAYVDGLTDEERAELYVSILSLPSQEQIDAAVEQAMEGQTRETMEETLVSVMTAQMGMGEEDVRTYAQSMDDEEVEEYYVQLLTEQVKMQYAAQVQQQTAATPREQLTMALDMALEGYTTAECARFYDELMTFSESTYEDNLIALGCLDLDSPASISLYASSFENKDVIEEAIASYNDSVEELSQIHYTDYVGIMMNSVTSIIDAITYVLIAFVAISLVVSCIMIGVITLISVQERTKEIGILRAIGASKGNVSSMFTAETLIIGCIAGLLGIGITNLLCIPVNAVLKSVTGIPNLQAYLPWQTALILLAISMVLTLIAGVIPSRSAAKKDPVVALRSE